MEMQLEILVVGTHPQILETVLRLLNKHESWHAMGAATTQQALALAAAEDFQVLLIGAGLRDEEEKELVRQICEIRPAIVVVPHYGGGSGLLYAEIYLALGIRNQPQ